MLRRDRRIWPSTGHGADHLPADAAQPRGGRSCRLDDDRVLRQQRRPQHPLHRAPRAHPRLAQPRRLREAGLLQPGARDLRPDLRRRTGRHRPLRPTRRAHPAGEVPDRRPAPGGADPARPAARSPTLDRPDRAVRADLAGPVRRHAGCTRCRSGERIVERLLDRGCAGDLPGAPVQLPLSPSARAADRRDRRAARRRPGRPAATTCGVRPPSRR